jgi:hypothetical protein
MNQVRIFPVDVTVMKIPSVEDRQEIRKSTRQKGRIPGRISHCLLKYEAYGNHQAFNQNSLKTQTVKGRNDAGNQQVKKDLYPVALEASGSRMDATQAIH